MSNTRRFALNADNMLAPIEPRPPLAEPTVFKLGVGGPDGCDCPCHDTHRPGDLFAECDDCAAEVHIPATLYRIHHAQKVTR